MKDLYVVRGVLCFYDPSKQWVDIKYDITCRFNRTPDWRHYRHFLICVLGMFKTSILRFWGGTPPPPLLLALLFAKCAADGSLRALCEKKRKEKGRYIVGPQNSLFSCTLERFNMNVFPLFSLFL